MHTLRAILPMLLLACAPCRGEEEALADEKLPEEAPLVSPGKSFSIVRAHDKPTPDDPYRIEEKVIFAKPGIGEVKLEATDWRGLYFISPDDRWILRNQKTGSGASIAILYQVEKDGRVIKKEGFNGKVWAASDAVSRFRSKDLFHTAVQEVTWTGDSKSVVVTVAGIDTRSWSGGITTQVTYNIAKNGFEAKPLPDGTGKEDGK